MCNRLLISQSEVKVNYALSYVRCLLFCKVWGSLLPQSWQTEKTGWVAVWVVAVTGVVNDLLNLSKYGIAPFFKKKLIDSVKASSQYVVLFDESLNDTIQSKQMDIHVRYWSGDTVQTRYLVSQFLGHASANDLQNRLFDALEGFHLSSVVQIAMDGPNVNWRLYEDMQKQINRDYSVSLINIGSCGLHQVHGAFQNGGKTCGWGLENFLSACYWLF